MTNMSKTRKLLTLRLMGKITKLEFELKKVKASRDSFKQNYLKLKKEVTSNDP